MFTLKEKETGNLSQVEYVTFTFYESEFNDYGVCNGVDVTFTPRPTEGTLGHRFSNRYTPDSIMDMFHEYYEVIEGKSLYKWELKPMPEDTRKKAEKEHKNDFLHKSKTPRDERLTISLLKHLQDKAIKEEYRIPTEGIIERILRSKHIRFFRVRAIDEKTFEVDLPNVSIENSYSLTFGRIESLKEELKEQNFKIHSIGTSNIDINVKEGSMEATANPFIRITRK